MNGLSDFRFLGIIADSCAMRKSKTNADAIVSKFTIAVRASKNGMSRFPVLAYNELAEYANETCRVGAKVAVKGTIVSEDVPNPGNKRAIVRTYFVASEILLIAKPTQKSLTSYARRFSELTELSLIKPKGRYIPKNENERARPRDTDRESGDEAV